MVTRRTDARRRRVLAEEFVPTSESALVDRKPAQTYSYGANRRNQPKTTDLIPKRLSAAATFFLFVLSLVTGLNLLASKAGSLGTILGPEAAECLAISGAGTLTNWVCSLSLFLCGALCVQLFLLRKYKRDDYGGMYRVWIVMASMFFLASVDCAVDLRTIMAKLFELLTHRSLLHTPWLMMTIELIVLAVIVIRMLFEVRASRFALGAVLLVWLGFVGCVVFHRTDLSNRIDSMPPQFAYGNCMLLGCLGSLVSLTFYARFVFLHAHGLIRLKTVTTSSKPATKKPKKKKVQRSPEKVQPDREPTKQPQPQTQLAAKPEVEQPAASKPPTTPKKRKKPVVRQAAAATSEKAKPARPAQPTRPTQPKQPAETSAEPEPASKRTEGPLASRLAKAKSKQKAAAATQAPPSPQPKPQPQPPQKAAARAPAVDNLQQELDEIDAGSISKSERRRLRKLAKRAAREKKAA